MIPTEKTPLLQKLNKKSNESVIDDKNFIRQMRIYFNDLIWKPLSSHGILLLIKILQDIIGDLDKKSKIYSINKKSYDFEINKTRKKEKVWFIMFLAFQTNLPWYELSRQTILESINIIEKFILNIKAETSKMI